MMFLSIFQTRAFSRRRYSSSLMRPASSLPDEGLEGESSPDVLDRLSMTAFSAVAGGSWAAVLDSDMPVARLRAFRSEEWTKEELDEGRARARARGELGPLAFRVRSSQGGRS
jgi:hypothetical protein